MNPLVDKCREAIRSSPFASAIFHKILPSIFIFTNVLVDNCRLAQLLKWTITVNFLQSTIVWWLTPASLYFPAGWNLRICRAISAMCFVIMGLQQLYTRARYAKCFTDAIFGVAHCPPARSQHISYLAWTFSLQFFSGFMWTPLSWCSRLLQTPSSMSVVKYTKILLLVIVEFFRGMAWLMAALHISSFWLLSVHVVPVMNIFVVAFAVFVLVFGLLLVFLYIKYDSSFHPPMLLQTIAETVGLLRATLQYRHLLLVFGNIVAWFGYFGCRDCWFREDALNSGIGNAVRATLPGLIGPIYCDQADLSDAVAAMRGLRNKWNDLKEKEKYIVDSATLVYTLSYKHIPVDHNGTMRRLSEARATDILRKLMASAKSHSYNRLMLWCDGASSCGVRTDQAWVDIGLLPYAIYRTFRVDTSVHRTCLMSNRLWLDLEKALSRLTCGMDVIDEDVKDTGVSYYAIKSIAGQGHKSMAAVIRMASRIVQGDYEISAASRESDKSDIMNWAKKILMRSGVREMNEALGWSGDPIEALQAKAVLTRISGFSPQKSRTGAEVGKICLPTNVREECSSEEAVEGNKVEPWRTEFWLRLLQFSEQEIGKLENEDLELTSYRFEEERTGKWEAHVVSLQGDYYISMSYFENVEPVRSYWCRDAGADIRVRITDQAASRELWLVTNSHVKKIGKDDKWAHKMIEEMFKTRGMFDTPRHSGPTVLQLEWERCDIRVTEDSAVKWFNDVCKETAKWLHYVNAKIRERNGGIEYKVP